MRIVFDGATLRPKRTGVGYYTEHLLRHLAAHLQDDELIVVSNRPIDTTAPLPPRVRVITDPRRRPRMAWMQLVVPGLLRRLKADVAHFTNGMIPLASSLPTRAVVTIHDMSLTMFPRYHPPRRVVLNRPQMRWAAHRASAIVTVSHSAKRDIASLYKLPADRVHVIHEAAAPSFRPVRDAATLDRVRARYGLADRVMLYVGTIEPRKNLPRLIEAFARRRHAGDLPHQLVCAGPYGWLSRDMTRRIERLGIADAVRFVGYVPFEDLPALYSLSEMFVFPSLYEGFGLPVVEAMACGTPVIAARAASLVEITDGAVEYIDPFDVDALGAAMATLASSARARAALAARGLDRARTFSWDRAARETLSVYRSVAEQKAASSWRRARRRVALGPSTDVPSPRSACDAGPAAAAEATILFGQARFQRPDPEWWDAQRPYAPLGTLHAASYLRARGHRVRLFDAMLAESDADWGRALDAERPRVAVLYEDDFNGLTKTGLPQMHDATLAMIDAARDHGATTIVAGSDATDHPAVYLERGAAAVVLGEVEATLAEIVDRLSSSAGGPLHDVAGIAYLDARGLVVRTPARVPIRDLDELPFPAWDLVEVERYRALWQARHGYFSMNLATTRGRPARCTSCGRPTYGPRYASRSPEHVADEMAWLAERYAPDHLWIADDVFGLEPGWIPRFAALVTARGLVTPFTCLLRADQVTGDVADALGAAGCRTARIGAASGSQRILDVMEKGTRVDQIVEAARLLRRAGIQVGFLLPFGCPGETLDDIERTLELVRFCRPDDIGVSVSSPVPGTPFFEPVTSQAGPNRRWVGPDEVTTMYRATYVAEFYRTLHRVVHGEFRARRAGATLRDLALRPWTVGWRDLRQTLRGVGDAVELPWLRRRLDRLASLPSASPTILPMQALTPDAAAIPEVEKVGI